MRETDCKYTTDSLTRQGALSEACLEASMVYSWDHRKTKAPAQTPGFPLLPPPLPIGRRS